MDSGTNNSNSKRERGSSFGHAGGSISFEELNVMKLMEEIMEFD